MARGALALARTDPGGGGAVEWLSADRRQGLLRDISEVFAKEKMNVIGVQTQSVKGTAWMTFTVEVADSQRLGKVLTVVQDVKGVNAARRR